MRIDRGTSTNNHLSFFTTLTILVSQNGWYWISLDLLFSMILITQLHIYEYILNVYVSMMLITYPSLHLLWISNNGTSLNGSFHARWIWLRFAHYTLWCIQLLLYAHWSAWILLMILSYFLWQSILLAKRAKYFFKLILTWYLVDSLFSATALPHNNTWNPIPWTNKSLIVTISTMVSVLITNITDTRSDGYGR